VRVFIRFFELSARVGEIELSLTLIIITIHNCTGIYYLTIFISLSRLPPLDMMDFFTLSLTRPSEDDPSNSKKFDEIFLNF
jgi:hypothetical protein